MFTNTRKVACAAVLSILAAPCVAAQAQAESAGAPPGTYLELVSEALLEFDAGHFAESRALFLHAHALKPSARTLRGLGLASFELREYRAASNYLTQALASQVHPLSGELRESSELLLLRANAFLGRFTLRPDPPFLRLRINGAPVDLSKPLVLDLGSYQLSAAADGYIAHERTLHVLGGERDELQIVLTPAPKARAPKLTVAAPEAADDTHRILRSAPVGERQDAPSTRTKRALLWSGAALIVASAAVSTAVLARREGRSELADPTQTPNTPVGGVVVLGAGQ